MESIWGAADRKRAYGYIRVSTKQQAGEDRYGADAQKQAIEDYAKRNGYTIIKWFNDEISGVKEDRPQLNGILYTDLAKRDGVEAVIAFKSDRIARDIKLYFYYLSLLDKKGIKLISVNEQFENVPDGVASLVRAIMMFVAEQERQNITMRTKSGRKIKAEFGGYSGGKPPYGYKAVDHKLVPNPKEAEMVCRVFSMRGANCTMQDIADTINDLGYRTRKGGYFVPSNIQRILDNKYTYTGYYKYGKNGEWVKGQHKPLFRIVDGVLHETYEEPYPDLNENAPNRESVSEPDKSEQQEPVQSEPPRPATFVGGVFGVQ